MQCRKIIRSFNRRKGHLSHANSRSILFSGMKIFRLKTPRTQEEIYDVESHTTGSLCDVAPTILEAMSIEIPNEMTGESLFTNLISYL